MPDSFKRFIADLSNPALLRSRESSPTLARVLTDLYVQEERPNGTAEMIRFAALMAGLLERLGRSDRRIIAEKLGRRSDVSAALVRMLAEDEPEVAAPLLAHSPQLDDATLMRLAERTEVHRAAIARRPDLTRALVTRLVDAGGPETAAALAANAALRFEPPLVARLVERLRDAPVAARAFVEREDVAGADAAPLFLAASEAGRRKILAGLEAQSGPGRNGGEPLIAALAGDAGDVLYGHAADGRSVEIVASLAKLLRLSPELAETVLADAGGEPLLVALKALRISDELIVSILIHANPAVGHSVARLRTLAELAPTFGAATADRLVAAWRGEPVRAGHAPQHAPAERPRRDDVRPAVAQTPEKAASRA